METPSHQWEYSRHSSSVFYTPYDGLGWIDEHIKGRKLDENQFSAEQLDGIVADRTSQELEGGRYVEDHFLKDIQWWEAVVDCIMQYSDEDIVGLSAAKKARRDRLLDLLGNALRQYPKAMIARFVYGWPEDDELMAGEELLRRYRLFTRGVCEAAKEVWPDVDLKPLFDQP